MNDINQYPEESYDDWCYRVILSKARKEISESWQTIASTLGLDFGGEHLRKMAHGLLHYREYLDSRYRECNSDTSIDEIEDKKMDLEREKMRLQDQKRELKKLLREWARGEHLQEMIRDSIDNLPVLPHITHNTDVTPSKNEGILMLSDWHIGMVTDNCCNAFNHAVLAERVDKLTTKTLEHCRLHQIHRLHVFALGDLVNGLIHVTTRIGNEENVIQQSMLAAELLSGMINRLSEELDVEVYWSRGNHDRVTANKKESVCGESFADLIIWYLRARLEGIDAIHFQDNTVDDEIIVTEIMGQTVMAVHGHKDKPANAVQNLSLLLKTFPSLVLMGHFHSAAEREIQGAEVIVNGSLCGTDDYAMSLRRTSKPSQKLLVINREGRLCTYNITL